MALFGETIVEEITELVRQRHGELGRALGRPARQEHPDQREAQSSLRHDLNLLIRVANGEYSRAKATPATVRRVELALQRLLDLLLGNALHTNITIPDDFWPTQIGILVSRARWWISADDLITISNAAALAFGENTQANRMRIARAMDKGLLEWVHDPSVANPQQNRRVLRAQVEQLRDQRQIPE